MNKEGVGQDMSCRGQSEISTSAEATRNNLNMENTFVDLAKQLVQSKSDNSYVPQTGTLSRFR